MALTPFKSSFEAVKVMLKLWAESRDGLALRTGVEGYAKRVSSTGMCLNITQEL